MYDFKSIFMGFILKLHDSNSDYKIYLVNRTSTDFYSHEFWVIDEFVKYKIENVLIYYSLLIVNDYKIYIYPLFYHLNINFIRPLKIFGFFFFFRIHLHCSKHVFNHITSKIYQMYFIFLKWYVQNTPDVFQKYYYHLH